LLSFIHSTRGRHIRQEGAEPLRHRGVRENGIAQRRIRQPGEHHRLHRGHDLAGLGADHREAENTFVTSTDESFHEALLVAGRLITAPNCPACRIRWATFALQISFLLGRQLTLGQEPPIHRRSTTAVRRPDRAKCQAGACRPLHGRGPRFQTALLETCLPPCSPLTRLLSSLRSPVFAHLASGIAGYQPESSDPHS